MISLGDAFAKRHQEIAELQAKLQSLDATVAQVTWVEGTYDGAHGWHCGFATVWDNGTWHTWDAHGVGGANASSPSVVDAKCDAIGAAIAQGFVTIAQLHGAYDAGPVDKAWLTAQGFQADRDDYFINLNSGPALHVRLEFGIEAVIKVADSFVIHTEAHTRPAILELIRALGGASCH